MRRFGLTTATWSMAPSCRLKWPVRGLRRESTLPQVDQHEANQLVDAIRALLTRSKGAVWTLRDVPASLPEDLEPILERIHVGQIVNSRPDVFKIDARRSQSPTIELRLALLPSTHQELGMLIPTDQWIDVAEVYASMSDEGRDDVRNRTRTLRNALQALDHEFVLSQRELRVVRRPGLGQPVAAEILATDPDAEREPEPPVPSPAAAGASASNVVAENTPFDFSLPPPPPPSFQSASSGDTTSSRQAATEPAGEAAIPENALHVEMLNAYIPSFFVPVEEVLDAMPGYSMDHLELCAKSKTLQIVRIEGKTFVRTHGWFGKTALTGIGETNERLRKYELRTPQMMKIFKKCFANPGTWKPLSSIVARVENDPDYQALSFHGNYALLYFAQQQHLFAFTPDNGGAVAAIATVTHLGPAESPCPLAFNEVVIATNTPRDSQHSGAVDSKTLDGLLSAEALRQLRDSFANWQAFVTAHANTFVLTNGVIAQRRAVERATVKELSLQQQLEIAYQTQNKKKIRQLRRRMAVIANPDNPLLEGDNLARAIADFLPPDRPVKLKTFLLNVPRDVVDLMPNSFTKFFANHPTHFRFFEWKYPNNHCVMRADLPLPDGVVRAEYDDLSLLAVVVKLFQKKNPQSSVDMLLHAPTGARDALRKKGGLIKFLAQFPENFVLVASGGREDAFICTMVSIPEGLTTSSNDDDYSGED